MHESRLAILLDQNIPLVAASWLRDQRPHWKIQHVNELGFLGRPDEFLYRWAQENEAIIVTYDEDFADARMYPLGHHRGICPVARLANDNRANTGCPFTSTS